MSPTIIVVIFHGSGETEGNSWPRDSASAKVLTCIDDGDIIPMASGLTMVT